MIIESITIIFFALVIDFALGDPKNNFILQHGLDF